MKGEPKPQLHLIRPAGRLFETPSSLVRVEQLSGALEGSAKMWRWRLVIGLASVGQVVAGLVFFRFMSVREVAPFGLALCAGIGLLSVASQATRTLVRAAIGANILLALLVVLGIAPLVVALATGAAEPSLAGFILGDTALAVASVANAVAVWRLSSQTTRRAEPGTADVTEEG